MAQCYLTCNYCVLLQVQAFFSNNIVLRLISFAFEHARVCVATLCTSV